jgi:hypothetical protein
LAVQEIVRELGDDVSGEDAPVVLTVTDRFSVMSLFTGPVPTFDVNCKTGAQAPRAEAPAQPASVVTV